MTLKEGQPAPAFSALNSRGETVTLKDFKGKNIVLYFYPKDDTPGCTIEAKEFTEHAAQFAQKDTVVLGVSVDDSQCHRHFIEKYNLQIELLADPEQKIAKAYDSDGQSYAQRNTIVIDKQGNIKNIFKTVKPQGHALGVLKALG